MVKPSEDYAGFDSPILKAAKTHLSPKRQILDARRLIHLRALSSFLIIEDGACCQQSLVTPLQSADEWMLKSSFRRLRLRNRVL
jgi:hypothetical protein